MMQRYRSVFAPGLFAGQVAVVTGGGSGIGRCIAHELASLGAQVALVGRNREKLERTAGEIRDDGGRAGFEVCDIRDEAAVRAAIASVVAAHGRIDALVNNAGGQYITPLAAITAKGWEAVIHTNLTGGFLVARECFLQSMQANGGAIVNIVADIWGSMPNMGHSGAARAGMVSFTETAALEWAASGVMYWPPALLTRPSTRPCAATMPATAARTASSCRMSKAWMPAFPPAPAISACTCCSFSTLRPTSTTCAPSDASSCAVQRPIPEPPPVTTITCPANRPGANTER